MARNNSPAYCLETSAKAGRFGDEDTRFFRVFRQKLDQRFHRRFHLPEHVAA